MSSTAGAEVVGDGTDLVVPLLVSTIDPLERARRICGRLNAAHAELIDFVAERITDDTWAISGIRSVEHWLTCFTGVSPATARDLTCITTRRVELPALGRELATGRLSLGQAAVVTAHTPIGYDFTEPTTHNQTDTPPVAPDALSIAAAPAELSMHFTKDRFHLTYSAPADIGTWSNKPSSKPKTPSSWPPKAVQT